MKIVAGLGNPGPKYETTRHNAGFLAIDRMVEFWRASGPSSAYEGEVWQCTVGGEKILLVKPQTWMNNSGKCVAPIVKFYKCAPTDVIVIHDEVDLKPMALRIKTGGGTGGHNGLKSLDAHLGAGMTGYHRIRIGVGKSTIMETADHVLGQYTDEELKRLDPLLDDVVRATEKIIAGDVRGAMTQFNQDREK